MEMKKLEGLGETGLFQHLAGSHEIGGVETEFGVLTAAWGPFAGAFAM
jgi:hypothetical protein